MPRQWTPEQRAAQAERIKALKPWTKSTGPRTAKGKKTCCRNALKHGKRSAFFIEAKAMCKLNSEFLRLAKNQINHADYIKMLEESERCGF